MKVAKLEVKDVEKLKVYEFEKDKVYLMVCEKGSVEMDNIRRIYLPVNCQIVLVDKIGGIVFERMKELGK